MNAPKLTSEQRQAILERNGGPVPIVDDQSDKTYYLISEAEAPNLVDNWVGYELQKGFDAADQGKLVDWNPQQIKAEGRRRLAEEESQG